jgi:tight adherence protein C
MAVFLGVKLLLAVAPTALALLAASVGLVPFMEGLLGGCVLSLVGLIAPSFWLDRRKVRRQTELRRALPDALDVIVVCLEGGLSLPGSVRRVAGELRTAHPLLARELEIVQREVQLGRTTGEALRQMADRADLEELRSLASVVAQSERFGASLVKALRVHAESLRYKRLQYAEEMAQKAATKVLFPTVLFILPAVFVIILAPGIIQILAIFQAMSR